MSFKTYFTIRERVRMRRELWEAMSKPLGTRFLMSGGRHSMNFSSNVIHNRSGFVTEK